MRRYRVAIIGGISFAVGCAVAPFIVPPLSAQQQNVQRWEYMCFEALVADDIERVADRAGREGWEMVAAGGHERGGTWCFKRPL
jgi:hypothetical protein